MTTPQPAALPELSRGQIIDLISPLSKNSADHDIEFANRVIAALAVLQSQQSTQGDAPAATEFNGWYCAHCQRGVDAIEVTYHEQHTVCGRVITNDAPPAPQPAAAGVSDAEWWHDVLGSAGPDLLNLAKKWDANEVHVYQFVNEAEKIVKAAAQRAILALRPQAVPMTRDQREQVFRDAENRMMREINLSWRDAVVECVEAHHGITAQAK